MSIHIQPSGAAIAEIFLENAACCNPVRGMLDYAGSYRGKTVSIQGTGMGMPSLGYTTELMKDISVKTAIRIGTCGAICEGANI